MSDIPARMLVLMQEQDSVRAFHESFGVGISPQPELPTDRVQLRMSLLDEELSEVRGAIESGDVVAVAKELADLLYVTFGAAVEFGIPLHEVFAAVHEQNMAKLWEPGAAAAAVAEPTHPAHSAVPARGGMVVRRADGKVLKPPGFGAPDIAAVLFPPDGSA